ncbi:hypothetical protein BV22DRAFT_1026530, partial [Leucogyrophana mollusca]
GDSGGFKEQTYNAAAIAIAIHHTAGPEKTGKMVLTKWNAIFNAIEAYCGLSGTHWDNVHGATIRTADEIVVWDEFIKKKVSAPGILWLTLPLMSAP